MNRIAIILALALCAPMPDASAQWLGKKDLDRAEELFKQGRFVEARKIYESLAADYGHRLSQFRLGYIYQSGLGTPVDCMAAARWYTYASTAGDGTAALNLSGLYQHGCEGLEANASQAERWLSRSAELGESGALLKLAYRMGIEKNSGDPYTAYGYVVRAARDADPYSLAMLAVFEARGIGTTALPAKGLNNLMATYNQESRFGGHQRFVAQELARLYEEGIGSPSNLVESFKSALVSRQHGGDADQRVERLRASLSDTQIAEAEKAAQVILRDVAESVLSEEELFAVFLEARESDPRRAQAMLAALDSQNSRYGDAARFFQELRRAPSKQDQDALTLYAKRTCQAFPGGAGCVRFTISLWRAGRQAEACQQVERLALPKLVELDQDVIVVTPDLLKVAVACEKRGRAVGWLEALMKEGATSSRDLADLKNALD